MPSIKYWKQTVSNSNKYWRQEYETKLYVSENLATRTLLSGSYSYEYALAIIQIWKTKIVDLIIWSNKRH